MAFGRHSPAELWSRAAITSELQSNRGSPTAYIHGYFSAAIHLAEQMVANRVPVDTVAYPALFLFRHAIELGFKVLLRGYSFELRSDPPLGEAGHSLAKLWGDLRPLLASDYGLESLDPDRPSKAVTLDDIDALVECLHAVDPNGEAARYDTYRGGQFTMPEVKRVNLEALLELCRQTEDWLAEHIHCREELVAYVRMRRRERGEE